MSKHKVASLFQALADGPVRGVNLALSGAGFAAVTVANIFPTAKMRWAV